MKFHYMTFYQEVANFLESIGLADKGCFQGLTEAEILAYENDNDIKFGAEYRTALKTLGKQLGYNLIYIPPNLNKLNQLKAEEKEYRIDMELMSNDIGWKEEIKEHLEKNIEFKSKYSIDEPIILNYYDLGGDLTFTLSNSEEFILHNYNLDSKVLSYSTPFIVSFRRSLLNGLIAFSKPISDNSYFGHYKKHLTSEVKNNLDKIPWLKFYNELINKKKNFVRSTEFQIVSYHEELQKGIFLGIDEFEVKHLRHRRQINEIDSIYESLDNGKKIITFREYL